MRAPIAPLGLALCDHGHLQAKHREYHPRQTGAATSQETDVAGDFVQAPLHAVPEGVGTHGEDEHQAEEEARTHVPLLTGAQVRERHGVSEQVRQVLVKERRHYQPVQLAELENGAGTVYHSL